MGEIQDKRSTVKVGGVALHAYANLYFYAAIR